MKKQTFHAFSTIVWFPGNTKTVFSEEFLYQIDKSSMYVSSPTLYFVVQYVLEVFNEYRVYICTYMTAIKLLRLHSLQQSDFKEEQSLKVIFFAE